MRKNRGFALIAIIPILLLITGLIVGVYLLRTKTGFFNRASGLAETGTNPSPWSNAVSFPAASPSAFINVAKNYSQGGDGLKITGSFTVELWIKPTRNPWGNPSYSNPVAICKTVDGWGASSKTPFCLTLGGADSSHLSASWSIGTNNHVYSQPGALIPLNDWSHLAVSVDASTGTIRSFLNGKLGTTNSGLGQLTFDDLNEGLTIGALYRKISGTNEGYFQGEIDEVRISNNIRYTSDFSKPMTPFTPDANTLALWHFDQLDSLSSCGAFPMCYKDFSGHENSADGVHTDIIPSTVPYISVIPTYNTCQNNACIPVQGIGKNSCQLDSDCQPKSHKECINLACQTVNEPGTDSCKVSAECQPIVHNECTQALACAQIVGPGTDSCSTKDNCKPSPTHFECTSQKACKEVTGSGENGCKTDSDCVTPTHLACQNYACIVVTGPGSDTCKIDENCAPKNLLVNPSFEIGTTNGWIGKNLQPSDAVDKNTKFDGNYSFRFSPASTKREILKQNLSVSGPANDAITFEFWNKMDKKSTANTAGASLTVIYKNGGKAFVNTTFDKNVHDWTKQRLVVKPLEAYSQVSVVFFNQNTTSKIWLDQTSLTIKTGVAASGAKTSPSTIKGNEANALLNSF
jgi:hypothetical protein